MAKSNPEKPAKRKLIRRLRNKYRLLLMNDSSFEEYFSLRLTPMNVIMVFTASFFILGAFYVSLIVFTPLREYIPGYADTGVKSSIIMASLKADSLQEEIEAIRHYQENLVRVLQGKVFPDSSGDNQLNKKKYEDIDFTKSEEDSLLRLKIEEQEQYNLVFGADPGSRKLSDENYFFPPIRGVITSPYEPAIGHFGIDITAPENEAIKSTLDGTVLVSTWTSDGGYVIHLQHSNNLISVYKHNSVLLKNVGDKVSAGDPIAIIGNTGEYSTGPHLHFELWQNGQSLNPERYIVFK